MPICITCSTPVKNLYTVYSKADDRSLGKGVRLTQCPGCKRFADKYVEHDFVVLFIDLVLIKPQVYRHLLFNRLGGPDDTLDPSILRLGTLLILFDVYLTWARIEKSGATADGYSPAAALIEAPIILQYLFFLTSNVLATLAHQLTVRLFARLLLSRRAASNHVPSPLGPGSSSPDDLQSDIQAPCQAHGTFSPELQRAIGPGYASPSAISTALLVSSCTKLFPILLVIWPTQSSEDSGAVSHVSSQSFATRARSYVGWVVLLNNIEALQVLLDCGYVAASALAMAGLSARWLVEGIMLGAVGLEGDAGPIGDLSSLLMYGLV